MAPTDTVNYSDLLRSPRDTIDLLAKSRRRSLRVNRRGDDEDLVLTTASRADADAEVVHTATVLLAAIVRNPVIRSQLALDVMREAFPWVRFLPPEDLEAFVAELTEVLSAVDALDNTAPAAMTIRAWKSTAEAYADPEVAEVLGRGATGDYGEVPDPPQEAATSEPKKTRRRSR